MRPLLAALLAALAAGCAGTRPSARPAAPLPAAPAAPAPAILSLPDRLTLPASYRLVVLDGNMALVRESDAEVLSAPPASLRVVTGEVERGQLAYQPALLPQEVAAQVAASRESTLRMDGALASVLARSRELAAQALRLEAQSADLEKTLASAEARIAQLEAASKPSPRPAAPAPEGSDPLP